MRVVRGAFVDPSLLDKLGSNVIEKLADSVWQSIEKVELDLDQVKELQKNMTHHFDAQMIPWYMDGYGLEDKNDKIVAFGADDGEDGKIFLFTIEDNKTIDKIVKYGVNKGIPQEQLDFMDIDF